jgi:acetylglutamate kinase
MYAKQSMSQTPERILIKIGGNALTDESIKQSIVEQICELLSLNFEIVIVHGGGIEIKSLLDTVGITSQFIGGHRKTDLETIGYVEMALSSRVNKDLVSRFNLEGHKAVGISGKDGITAIAGKRIHKEDGEEAADLGFVGDVEKVDPTLIRILLENKYLPVLSPVSFGADGNTYNVNADMFAGHVAGAINADMFIALTNVDGLLRDVEEPGSRIDHLTSDEAKSLYGSVIEGGMIPKIDACITSLELGVKSARIINGTDGHSLLQMFKTNDTIGTTIVQ